nr:hypothetical protein [Tanacetum cinerariifolium]GFA21397.1 hypothetical protein [Tanacetum cinerariifolium]
RSNRRRIPNIVKPEIQTIAEIIPMADRTMEELLQAPTEGYGEAIVIPEILAENFEIKTNLLQLEANKFYGRENDNPHTHISKFKRITATLKYRDVPDDAIKLMLFPYSLEDRARIWACPHLGFLKLTQIDTFYNGLTEQDQDSLNAASGGNLLNKTTREALQIIENKSKVHYSRTKSNVSRVNTNSRDVLSRTDDRIDKLAYQISNLVEIVNKQVIAPAKAVEKTCVTYGGAHTYYECIATDSNPSSVCAATGSYNQLSLPNRASDQIPPPGFAPVQNNSNRFNQGQGNYFNQANNFNQGNNFRGNNFQNNQGYRAQMSNVSNFQNQAMLLKKLSEKLGDPDIACEDFVQDVLDFQYNPKSSNPTLVFDDLIYESNACKVPIVKSSSLILTPFGESDFFLEELKVFLNDDSIPIEIENYVFDPEGYILLIEKLLNEDPCQLPPMDLKVAEESKEKSFVEEPPELELKELTSHLEYAFLEDSNKLPVIIAKNLKVD